ncbi:MAG: S41 family peptidase [Desulfobacterales bacterium]|nr:S41 family peptidase [Desulfobacterales bacterium]
MVEAHRIAGTDYGYLLFPPISYEGMLEDVLSTMQVLTTGRTLEGLILDLRIAGSSGGWPLNELFTLFHDGAVGEFYNRTPQEPVQVEGQDLFTSQSVPMVILVGRNTQGFPEILAGGLQMHERAVVIGEATGGRIESSTAYLLPDGSRVYIETNSFVLPNGAEIGFNGVQPDVEIEAGWDDVFLNNDPVIDAAIRQLRTK